MNVTVKKYFVSLFFKEYAMKAWRNLAGTVVEIEVDLDKQGRPILPPDTTTATRPDAIDGHYVTVVGDEWVQIPVPVPFVSFETKKNEALNKLSVYKEWYTNKPVEHLGKMFDADELARGRLVQVLVVFNEIGYLPSAWITHDNQTFPLTTIDDLKGIITTVQTAFGVRFFEMNAIRDQILAADNEQELSAVVIPSMEQM